MEGAPRQGTEYAHILTLPDEVKEQIPSQGGLRELFKFIQ